MTEQLDLIALDEPNIQGLSYIENFISPADENALLETIDMQPWRMDLKRRVQHYGYIYDYKARSISHDMKLGPPPSWLDKYRHQFVKNGMFETLPDQIIVNEYLPGQGISPHIDCLPCFGNSIVSLSLGSEVVMDFTWPQDTKCKMSLRLAPRSIVILQGEARSKWRHGIAARKTDNLANQRIARSRRVSLTFRTVRVA